MDDVAKFPGLMARGTKWYARIAVPVDLVGVLGKREIWRSLKTGDHKKAKARYIEARAEVERTFALARRLSSADEARQLVTEFFDRWDRRSAEAEFSTHGPRRREVLGDLREEHAEAVWGGEGAVDAIADALLVEAGWPTKEAGLVPGRGPVRPRGGPPVADANRDSKEYQALLALLRRADVEVTRRAIGRLGGDLPGQPDPMFDGVGAGTPEPEQAPEVAGPTLGELLDSWLAEREPGVRTAMEWQTAARRFCELHGDMRVAEIKKSHVVQYKDAMRKLPSTMSKKVRAMPLRKIIAASNPDGGGTLSAASVTKYVGAIRSLLSYAVRNGHVEVNVASGVGVAGAKKPSQERLPYSTNELSAIMSGVAEYRHSHPSRFWLPVAATFTGMRLDELGQLRPTDVRKRDGIDFISVNEDAEGKSLKTRSSAREVPIHPELVRLGFVQYAEERRRAADEWLFPDLEPNAAGKRTGRFSPWFTRYRRKLGIKDPRKPFHALRHGFKQACRAAGVEEEVHDALSGHAGASVGRRYGSVPLATKANAIRKVKYEGLDLRHLYPRKRSRALDVQD